MSGELVDQLDPGKFFRETSTGYDIVGSSVLTNAAGPLRGLSLQKINPGSASTTPGPVWEYYNFLTTIPTNLTITTGLTFYLTLTDDGMNAADLGLVVDIGISVKSLTSAVTADL